MSLDVWLNGEETEVDCCCQCGHEHKATKRVCHYAANITHNLNRMADAAGIYKHLWRPEELGITQARELIEPLREGLQKLQADPEHFRQFNPANGWGSYEGLVAWVSRYLTACEEYPDAFVSISR